jgi:phage shock protein A
MNQGIATVKASVIQLEKELNRYKAEYNDLVSKMKASIQAGRDDIAANYAVRLETIKSNLGKTEEQLRTANMAYEKALEVKKAFMREKDRKIAEAREALRAHERAKWQAKIADTLEQFEVGGIDQTHDEMLRRVNEQTAKNEARVDMALDSVDTTSMKIEEEAEKLRAMELVKQFKMEMGQINSSTSDTSNADSQSDFLQDRNRTL